MDFKIRRYTVYSTFAQLVQSLRLRAMFLPWSRTVGQVSILKLPKRMVAALKKVPSSHDSSLTFEVRDLAGTEERINNYKHLYYKHVAYV